MNKLEQLIAKIELLQAQKTDLQKRLDASIELFRNARIAGASTDELKNLHQKGAALDDEIQKVTAEIKDLTEKKATLEFEESRNPDKNQAVEKAPTRIEKTAEDILEKLKVQVMPSSECVEMNEIFSKILFNRTDEQTQKLLDGGERAFKEKKRRRYKGKVKDAIVSCYTLQNVEGYEDRTPLDEFDRAVLGVIVSEYLHGNRYTTVNIIYRALIGKPGTADIGIAPNKNQKDAIINSVLKLMSKVVDLRQITENYKEMNYTDKNDNRLKLGKETILSAGIVDAIVDGGEIEGAVYFKGNSPLFDLADAKNQVIRYPHELLDVPNQNNTPLIITLKKYVMRRICEIKLHSKNMSHTVTFADVFKKCRVPDTKDRKEIMRRREYIIKFVGYLQEKSFIKSFEIITRNGAIYGFTIKFDADKTQ